MKKTYLLFVFLLISNFCFSQNVISLFAKANEFFVKLEEQKFDSAHQYFDPVEQTKITPENLKALWTNVKSKMGELTALDAVQSKMQGEFFAVTLDAKFERQDQDFVLMFNKAEKIVGLYMPQKNVGYTKPFYVDTALVSEKSVYLQSGTHQLAAVITTPKNATNFPIVVLVHGSGPSDMDGTVGPNKPLKDIALGLAVNGIATIRYVKRTVIYASEFNKAFTVKEEVVDDALAAVALAKTVKGADLKSVFVLGHSLGGMLAPKIATLVPDLKGIVLAAAPARKLTDIIIDQNKYLVTSNKDTTTATKKLLADAIVQIEKSRLNKLGTTIKPDSVILGLPASYWVDLNNYDQVATAQKLTNKIYVLQGGNDFQVSETDFELWKKALGTKPNATLKFYGEINHLLSPQLEKANSAQYQKMMNVGEGVIKDLSTWIKAK